MARLLDRIEGNGIRTVIVEDASRFARELVVQELGIALLAKRGVSLMTSSGDELTDSDDLGRKMMRQVAGAYMEYEKGRLVAKLRASVRRPARRLVGGNHMPSSGPRSETPSEGERQSRPPQLSGDQRQAERCRLLQRAWRAIQPSVGSSNDRGTAGAVAATAVTHLLPMPGGREQTCNQFVALSRPLFAGASVALLGGLIGPGGAEFQVAVVMAHFPLRSYLEDPSPRTSDYATQRRLTLTITCRSPTFLLEMGMEFPETARKG